MLQFATPEGSAPRPAPGIGPDGRRPPRRRAAVALVLSLIAVATGCGDDAGGGAGSTGTPGCTCEISENGAAQTLACGESGCVGGQNYACGEDAAIEPLGACTDPTTSATTSTTAASAGSGGGCSLFACTTTGECAFQPCMATGDGTAFCYPQAADASECGSGDTTVTARIDGVARLLCVPTGCSEPTEYVP